MTDQPRYGQRSDERAAPACPRHPGVRSIDYCKRCNRPTCPQCTIRTEVASICTECSQNEPRVMRRRLSSAGMPIVTYSIIAVCVLFGALGLVTNAPYQALSFSILSGMLEPWRFFTSAFLHSGLMHLALNMLALYVVGPSLEAMLGKWRFFTLYLLSAVGGSLAMLAWALVDPSMHTVIAVGASGAVFGLFGAVFVAYRSLGADTRSILGLVAVNLLLGFVVPNVAWQAHVGGLLTGMAVTWVFIAVARPRRKLITARTQELQGVLAAVGITIALVALIVLSYVLNFEALWA